MGGTSTTLPVLCCEHHRDQKKPKPDKGFHDHLNFPNLKQIKEKKFGSHCGVVFYVLFASLLLITALAELVISSTNTILIKGYSKGASDLVIGTVILAICAAIAALTAIYSMFAVCKKKCKALVVISVILGILAIVQILLVAFAVTDKKDDIQNMEVALTESFIKAKEHDKGHVELWNDMQSNLKCCGLHGPEDYRDPQNTYAPYNVYFSCCPAYHTNDTNYYNKYQRDLCILNKNYYTEGCMKILDSVFKTTTKVAVGVSILLIVLEIINFVIGLYLGKKCSKKHRGVAVAENFPCSSSRSNKSLENL